MREKRSTLAIHVCEGPLDALALMYLERLGLVELHERRGAWHERRGAVPAGGVSGPWRQQQTAIRQYPASAPGVGLLRGGADAAPRAGPQPVAV